MYYLWYIIKTTNNNNKKLIIMKAIVVKFENGLYLSSINPFRQSEESDCIHFKGINDANLCIKSNNFSALPFEIEIPEFSIAEGIEFDDTDYSDI